MKPLLLTNKCTGCGACLSVCKPGCIRLEHDNNGYFKAFNFEDGCNGCGHCKVVCPALHVTGEQSQRIIAFQHPNPEILNYSGSGGAFSVLAEDIIDKGGIVYGVCITEDLEAKYLSIDKKEDLKWLRNSKYIDINVGKIGEKLKKDADSGRPVLFVGLPCTVAGMRRLARNRPNVLWVDLLCFGKPSEIEWKNWISRLGKVTELKFKDKRNGVSKWGISFKDKNNKEIYIPQKQCPPIVDWLRGKNLDKQCLDCPFHSFKRPGDISLGDFWGIENYVPSLKQETIQRGISMVLFNSSKGLEFTHLFESGKIHEATQPYNFDKYNRGLTPHSQETKDLNATNNNDLSFIKQLKKKFCFWHQ